MTGIGKFSSIEEEESNLTDIYEGLNVIYYDLVRHQEKSLMPSEVFDVVITNFEYMLDKLDDILFPVVTKEDEDND